MAIPARSASASPLAIGPEPLAYRTIAEQIAERLRGAIAAGTLASGARLLEAPLARQMRTSRAPVREALALLERDGLVVKEPNRGARVVEFSAEMVREVATLRGVLEGFGAALAADRLTEDDLGRLTTLVAEMEQAARGGDFSALLQLDYEFHATICRASGHRMLYETWSGMERRVRLFLSATNLLYRDRRAVARGHAAILAALRGRDKARAQSTMAAHMAEMLEACAVSEAPATRAPRRRRA